MKKNWIVFFSSFFYFLLLYCDKFAYTIWSMCFSYWHKFIWFIDFLKYCIFISHLLITIEFPQKKNSIFVFRALKHAIQFDLFIISQMSLIYRIGLKYIWYHRICYKNYWFNFRNISIKSRQPIGISELWKWKSESFSIQNMEVNVNRWNES